MTNNTRTSLLYVLGRKLGMDKRDAEGADLLDLAEFSAGLFVGISVTAPQAGLKIAWMLLAGLGKCAAAIIAALLVAMLLAVAKAATGAAAWISSRYN